MYFIPVSASLLAASQCRIWHSNITSRKSKPNSVTSSILLRAVRYISIGHCVRLYNHSSDCSSCTNFFKENVYNFHLKLGENNIEQKVIYKKPWGLQIKQRKEFRTVVRNLLLVHVLHCIMDYRHNATRQRKFGEKAC